ncbi:MAG TPA: phosphate ABC transporter substrate-binding protein PstS [Kofleriaceae bacterium]|nr:phosphate ABC transporter substrate-binding protein PstS [Kofleriaceae bacterium]
MKLWLASLSISLLASCGQKQDARGAVTINGSGSTFQKAFQEVAIEGFTKAHPEITINYGGGGSGKGRQDFADMVTDYACSDAPYKQADRAKAKGGELVYVPVLLGAITVSYNLPGVDKLQLSADTIAKIFQREITTWADPAIAADNPGVKLPALDIVVAHRSDGSGTTEQFTLYLTKAAAGAWKLGSASSLAWPADTQAGNGNSGVAQIVKSTPGAIGYVDLPDAKASGLVYAAVKNQAGAYIEPTAASAQAAGDGIQVGDDATFVAVNAAGAAAYPVTAPTWCMAYVKPASAARGAAVKAYFQYMVTDGQKLIPEIDFAPLSKGLQDKAIAQVAKLQG